MNILFIFVVFFLIGPKSAHAYIDPGTGSYLFQIAIGSLLAGLYFLKRFWKSVTAFTVSLVKKLLDKKVKHE